MLHDPTSGPPDPELAHELFNLVESDQGYAFISDAFREHAFNDDAWMCLGGAEVDRIIDELQ